MTSKQLNNDTWLDILNGKKIADSNNKEEKEVADIRRLIRQQEEACIGIPSDCELNNETERFLEKIEEEKKKYNISDNHNKDKWYSIIFSKVKNNFRHSVPAIGAIALLTLAGVVVTPIVFQDSLDQISVSETYFKLTSDMRYKGSNLEEKIKIIKSNDPENEFYKISEELKKDKNIAYIKSNGAYLIKLNKPVSNETIDILKKNNMNLDDWSSLQITFIKK